MCSPTLPNVSPDGVEHPAQLKIDAIATSTQISPTHLLGPGVPCTLCATTFSGVPDQHEFVAECERFPQHQLFNGQCKGYGFGFESDDVLTMPLVQQCGNLTSFNTPTPPPHAPLAQVSHAWLNELQANVTSVVANAMLLGVHVTFVIRHTTVSK